jgi:methionyl-tRNA formyltransferase
LELDYVPTLVGKIFLKEDNNMRIILFALTGFANKVLDVLLRNQCDVVAIFTRPERGPFPYYPEENISEYAAQKKIATYEEFTWDQAKKIITESRSDLLLVATFHRIIPNEIISLFPLSVNIHPSLLPKYRGATPIAWAIFNKETETGVTAHLLTEKLDAGDILLQKTIPIERGDTDNELRKKLAILSMDIVQELVEQIKTNSLNPIPQNEEEATYFSKFKN